MDTAIRQTLISFGLLLLILSLSGTDAYKGDGKREMNVGLLVTDTIQDQGWGTKAYKALF
ncbi:hypothetical protein [Bacillus sp. 1P06AnD]|uniref:hypothetical protein n=1 Tax=Bacillus sp. 1P06AnD TaxID=3132208 RepID=UPI00399F794B